MSSDKDPLDDIPDITDRERLIIRVTANLAADEAVERMTNTFYRNVGKFTVNKLLIIIGMVVIGFAVGRGWIKF